MARKIDIRVAVRVAGCALLVLLCGSAAVLWSAAQGGSTTTATDAGRPVHAAAAQFHRVACPPVPGPFRVVGTQVLDGANQPFVPYGVTVSGLTYQDYRARTGQDLRDIHAAATGWCANTVRIQVAQSDLVGVTGNRYSTSYQAAVDAEVRAAQADHLVVVLNDQTENRHDELAPDAATLAFWSRLGSAYRGDPQVIYDLFNEPRLYTGDPNRDWDIWQHGGRWHRTDYVGMQTVVDRVRAIAPNLVWVDGPHWGDTLAGVGTHRLTGASIVYAFHHPRGAHQPQVWERDFGYLVDQHIAPVVDGEWTNYAGARLECWPDAPATVPRYLRYLQRQGIGMTIWTLARGVMLQSRNLGDPNRFRANWSCTNGVNQGAGAMVRAWYRQQNVAH